ncbi:MAG: hypothetical protein NZP74_05720 [Anaerolineales bacterium]|nr:hypothetical protein [Anaerolineales bacterium]MDW8276434.1 lipocalin-like domain-containing protein [Anaerolineales bacterium]
MTKPVLFSTTPADLAREGLTETVQPWEDGLRVETGRGFFEWWYFDAHLDNGTTVVIVFATKPLLDRDGPLRPVVLVTLNCAERGKITHSAFSPVSEFHATREHCHVRIGRNYIEGDLHTYRVHVELPAEADTFSSGITFDLTFRSETPPWRPGAGKAYFGNHTRFFGWLAAIPYGSVEGTICCDGESRPVSGAGYHDHNWGNVHLYQVMDYWYWGRARLGDYTLIYVQQVTAQAYGFARIPVFLLAHGQQILTGDGSRLRFLAADFIPHPGGRAWPREVDFDWENGAESIHLSLRRPQLLEAFSLLASFPPWKRTLLRLFSNPYYFRFQAELVLSLHWGGRHVTERGTGLYELMILQGKKHP